MGFQDNVNVDVRGAAHIAPCTYKTVVLKQNITKQNLNVLTQAMLNEYGPNTKFVIKWDYTLKTDITIPANCILEFDGGSLSNGTLKTGNITIIGNDTVLNNIYIKTIGKNNSHVENVCIKDIVFNYPEMATERSMCFEYVDSIELSNVSITNYYNTINPEGYEYAKPTDAVALLYFCGKINLLNVAINELKNEGAFAYGCNDIYADNLQIISKNVEFWTAFSLYNCDSFTLLNSSIIRPNIGAKSSTLNIHCRNFIMNNCIVSGGSGIDFGFELEVYSEYGIEEFWNGLRDNYLISNSVIKEVPAIMYSAGHSNIKNVKFSNCTCESCDEDDTLYPLIKNGSVINRTAFEFLNDTGNIIIEGCIFKRFTRLLYHLNTNKIDVGKISVLSNEIDSSNNKYVSFTTYVLDADWNDDADNLLPINVYIMRNKFISNHRSLTLASYSNKLTCELTASYYNNTFINFDNIYYDNNATVVFLENAVFSDNNTASKLTSGSGNIHNKIVISNNNFTNAILYLYALNTYMKIISNNVFYASNDAIVIIAGSAVSLENLNISNNLSNGGKIKFYDDIAIPFSDTCFVSNNKLDYTNIVIPHDFWNGAKSVEYDGANRHVPRIGTYANKPNGNDIYIGFRYFCTDRCGCDELTPGVEIVYWGKEQGEDIWTDVFGRIVTDSFSTLSGAEPTIERGGYYRVENNTSTIMTNIKTKSGFNNSGIIILYFTTSYTTVVGSSSSSIRLKDGKNWNPTAGSSLILRKDSTQSGAWYEVSRTEYNNTSGTFANKPSQASIGFKYFCTDRKIDMDSSSPTYMQIITPVSPDTGGMEINYKGSDVWVDSLGRVVS